ncbi:MAG: peptidoglycan hydrolase-like protein with peptidoglycan-binding domain [Enterobacterales bacterium]|jgi:peptidoglycan hydrolase-like protein with peptidoglycan-binding domain
MIVRIGDKGAHVKEIQKALKKAGFWGLPYFTNNFLTYTDRKVRSFQRANDLVVDGQVGTKTLELLKVTIIAPTQFDEKYKGVTIQGSVFPDKPIKSVRVRLNSEMVNEYLPIMKEVMKGEPIGFQLLITAMAYKEGFRYGTRSYRTNNPGNIGNTDSGANKFNGTLKSGVELQRDFIMRVINGKTTAYPMGKKKVIKPYYSPEIAKHSKLYGMSPYVPGYEFVFTGQLDQFVKIYATGPRAGNGYLSLIKSYFAQNGIEITAQSKIQDIIKIS